MGPLVDTSVIVDAYRGVVTADVKALRHFLLDGPAPATGPIIVQEILQGFSDVDHYAAASEDLRAFEQLPAPTYALHQEAADLYRRGRRAGVTSSTVDVLVVAMARQAGRALLTSDRVQQRIADLAGVELA